MVKKMNKKGMFFQILIFITLIIILVGSILVIQLGVKDYEDYKEYKKFCEERKDFCYCGKLECSFRTSYINGIPTKETKEYCELSKRLENKKALFNGQCEE